MCTRTSRTKRPKIAYLGSNRQYTWGFVLLGKPCHSNNDQFLLHAQSLVYLPAYSLELIFAPLFGALRRARDVDGRSQGARNHRTYAAHRLSRDLGDGLHNQSSSEIFESSPFCRVSI